MYAGRTLSVALLCSALVGGGAVAASAASYPPDPPSCSLSTSNPTVEQSLGLSCVGFQPGSMAAISGSGSADATTTSATVSSGSGAATSSLRASSASAASAQTASFRSAAAVGASAAGSFTVPETAGSVGSGTFTVKGLDTSGAATTQTLTITVVAQATRAQSGSVSSSSVTPGQTFTFSGTGCASSTPVMIADDGAVVATMTSGSDGTFADPMSLRTVGQHTLTAMCLDPEGNEMVVAAIIMVTGSSSGALPFTGADDILVVLAAGVALVTAGSAFVLVGRRRS